MTKAAASSDRWVADVSTLVREELRRRVQLMEAAGRDLSALGPPDQMARRMLAAVPEPSAWNALGPFYSTKGVCRIMGGISRQAVEDRRKRHSLIALQTAEGGWVYPSFQFDERNRPDPAVVAVHRRLTVGRIGAWTAAATLLGHQPELGGRSITEHVRGGGAPEPVDELVAATVAALA